VLVDTGLRPQESYRLVWDSITWLNGRNGDVPRDAWEDESRAAAVADDS
jgi:hypothetical protein